MAQQDFDLDTFFLKTEFSDLGHELAKTTRIEGPTREKTIHVTLILVKIKEIPRQQHQFDPLSHTGKKRELKIQSNESDTRVASQRLLNVLTKKS